MYVTLLIYIGSSFGFHFPWALVLVLPVFLLLQFVVIIPEEKCLESSFRERTPTTGYASDLGCEGPGLVLIDLLS